MIDIPLFYMNSVDYFRWCFVWWMQKIEKNSRSFGWCFFMSQTKRFSFRRSLPSHSTSGVFVGICVFWSVGHITLRCCISKLSVPHKTIIARENFSCNFFPLLFVCIIWLQQLHLMLKANRFTFTSAPKTITACLKITDVALLCLSACLSRINFFVFISCGRFFLSYVPSSEILTDNLLGLLALS